MIVDSKYPKDNITELNICHSKLSMTEYKFWICNQITITGFYQNWMHQQQLGGSYQKDPGLTRSNHKPPRPSKKWRLLMLEIHIP